MVVELTDVRAFLARHEPFSPLPAEVLNGLPGHSPGVTTGAAASCAHPARAQHRFILRSGAVGVHDDQGILHERSGEGMSMAVTSLIERTPSIYTVTATATEDRVGATTLAVLRRPPPSRSVLESSDASRAEEGGHD